MCGDPRTDIRMLVFLVLALVVAAQRTVGRVSLDYISRVLLARGLLLVASGRACSWVGGASTLPTPRLAAHARMAALPPHARMAALCSQRKVGDLHVEAGETPRFAQTYER
ncbi:hypothetical protein T492DRAFT_908192 [Pavlovales sp. CCMP2436]|nr:hypothetical protein T492DRAFT_908192 [Pavlovales sp. CCMP2436]